MSVCHGVAFIMAEFVVVVVLDIFVLDRNESIVKCRRHLLLHCALPARRRRRQASAALQSRTRKSSSSNASCSSPRTARVCRRCAAAAMHSRNTVLLLCFCCHTRKFVLFPCPVLCVCVCVVGLIAAAETSKNADAQTMPLHCSKSASNAVVGAECLVC